MNSLRDFSRLTALSALLSFVAFSAHAVPILTGTWEGVWQQPPSAPGTVTMFVSAQDPSGTNFDLSGYFDWLCDPVTLCSGREEFNGSLFADGTLQLDGFNLVDAVGLALGTYRGTVSGDGNMISGDFSFLGGTLPVGTWSATRVATVPEPGTLALFGTGVIVLLLGRRRSPQKVPN